MSKKTDDLYANRSTPVAQAARKLAIHYNAAAQMVHLGTAFMVNDAGEPTMRRYPGKQYKAKGMHFIPRLTDDAWAMAFRCMPLVGRDS